MIYSKDDIRSLVYEMMAEEIHKLDFQKELEVDIQGYDLKTKRAKYEFDMCEADKRIYALGLEYQKMKIENDIDYGFDFFKKYPNVAEIMANKLIVKYGLSYSKSGNSIKDISDNRKKILFDVNNLYKKMKIPEFEMNRLRLAGNYLYDCMEMEYNNRHCKEIRDINKIKRRTI